MTMRCYCSIRLLATLIIHAFALTTRCCYSFVLPPSVSLICSSCGARAQNNYDGVTQQLMSRQATTTVAEIDTETISVALPSNWRDINDNWPIQAAEILTRFGVVALTSSPSNNNSNTGLISTQTIDRANESASSRLEDMQTRISNRGVDPNGIEDGPYRFAEIICRDEGGLRYDVPLPWLADDKNGIAGDNNRDDQVGSGRIGAPLTNMEKEGVADLHKAMDEIVPHVLEALWSGDDITTNSDSSNSYVAASGYLINKPGSKSQNWHKDGPDAGFIDCFVPLIDLNEELGPTSFRLDDDEDDELVPMLNKGNILLFDYRTIHRGQGNTSEDTTRTLAYAVYRRREVDGDGTKKESGDVHNFPAALTLEYD
mmetsp:Transcript_30105/g.45294  ORF Transcript_30105/g.45294 Transcript_30105/m.45294 type:complete len:371 (-) Transcript_30105:53-1165(-)